MSIITFNTIPLKIYQEHNLYIFKLLKPKSKKKYEISTKNHKYLSLSQAVIIWKVWRQKEKVARKFGLRKLSTTRTIFYNLLYGF